MVSSILNQVSSSNSSQIPESISEKPKSRASQMVQKAPVEDESHKLHAQEIQTPKFRKITTEDKSLDKEVQDLLKRYKVDSDGYHGAALSEDGKSLVIAHDGKTTLTENFGGASGFSRFVYKLTKAFRSIDKDTATAKYIEFFNNYDSSNKDVGMVMEPISHLFKGLSSNHYHGVSIFHKDEKTGKFLKTPSAISIIDSYKYIYQEHKKNHDVPDEFKNHIDLFDRGYALDKTIPVNLEKAKDFSALYREIAAGLYQAQGFSFLTIPGQVNKTLNSNSGGLNFVELPWHRVHQGTDKKWRVSANKKEFDSEMIENTKDREFYESRITDSEHSNITIVRPEAEAQKPLEPYIGFLENWSQMYSGNTLRAKNKDDQKLVTQAQKVCEKYIETYNAEFLKAA